MTEIEKLREALGRHLNSDRIACIVDDLIRAHIAPVGAQGVSQDTFTIEHDGFTGEVIGYYTTREGKRGVVLQQVGTRVVHVYGEKWLKRNGA